MQMNDSRERQLQRQRNWAFVVAGVCLLALGTFAILDRQSDSALPQSPVSLSPGSSDEERGPGSGRLTSERDGHQPVQDRVGNEQISAMDNALSQASRVPSSSERAEEADALKDGPIREFAEQMARNNGPVQLNVQFESEWRDPQWARHAETQLEDFMARHPYASAYENQTFECRETLCQFYAELEPAMVQAIQESPMGQIDPFAGLPDESLSTELQQISGSFGPNQETGRPAMLITFRRLTEE